MAEKQNSLQIFTSHLVFNDRSRGIQNISKKCPSALVDVTTVNFFLHLEKTRTYAFNFNITATPAFSMHITTFRMYIGKIILLKHYYPLVKLMKITRLNTLI